MAQEAEQVKQPDKTVIEFLEDVQAPGQPSLDREGFRSIAKRFSELSGIPIERVRPAA